MIASGSGKIEGSVTDLETGKFVPYATVELLKCNDSTLVAGTRTNDYGYYLLQNIPYGKYLIRISFIGYRKEYIPVFELTTKNPSIKFGNTNLITESTALGEVLVTGHKLTGVLEDDKTIYAIKGRSTEIAQSGLELLRQLPDVTVDYISDNVRLAGSNNILFQVNGRIIDRNYLMQLNPALVDKIEVITNPGAKYDSDIDAVINVILKKDIQYGLSGRLRLDIPTSKTLLGKNNASIDLFYKKFRFYVAGNFNLARYTSESSNTRRIFSPDSSVLSQNMKGINHGNKAGFSYGFDWFTNDKNIFNFYSSVRPVIGQITELTSDNVFTSDLVSTHNLSKSSTINKYFYSDYSLFFQHKFAKEFHEISFESYLSNKWITNNNEFCEQDYISDGILSDKLLNGLNQSTENGTRQLILKVDYTYPFSEQIKLSAGYNGNLLRADYSYNEEVSRYSDIINYNENRNSLYSNISWNIWKVNFQTGVRYELSDVHIVHGYDTTNQYNALLPSLSAQYKLGKMNTLRLSYRKSVTRPTVNQLSPTNYKDDSYMQSSGNPELKPSNANRIEFTHRIQLKEPMYLSYRPYINFIKNDIRQINSTTSDSVLLRKYSNVGNDLEYGITVSGTLAVLKIWTMSPSLTWYKRELKALPQYGIFDEVNRTSWRLNLSSQLILPKNWIIFAEYNYNASVINYQSITHPYWDLAAGFNKAINKKIGISAFFIFPWSKDYVYDSRTVTTNTMIQDTKESINLNHLFFFRLSYKFSIGKTGSKLERQVESDVEQGVGKGIIK
jgi:outer membrane receptor protein involved in Fe transport